MNRVIRLTSCIGCPHVDEDGGDSFGGLCLNPEAPDGSECYIPDYPEIPDWCMLEKDSGS